METPDAKECFEIVTLKSGIRKPKNNCNAYVNVWSCYKNYKPTKHSSRSKISECDNSKSHYQGLKMVEPRSYGDFYPYSSGYTIEYFSCKGRLSHITNNKKGETKFSCKTDKSLLEKYGFTE